MLQDIRASSQGTIAKVIIGLIVVSFSIFGIESLLVGGGNSGIAEVNGEPIDPAEVQQLVVQQQRRLVAMLGEQFDPAMLDEQQLTAQAIDALVQKTVQLQYAAGLGLAVKDRRLGRIVADIEDFQIDGAFSPELYRSVLAGQGFTPQSFRRQLRDSVLLNQLRAGIAGSEFVTDLELEVAARFVAEARDVRYLSVPSTAASAEPVTAADIERYYRDNSEEFVSPERAVVEYIELRLEDFMEPVPEEELRSEFEAVREQYQTGDEARVSHVLLIARDDESSEAFAERVERARSALAAGEDFATVAERYSDDLGSAAAGGDLGYTSGDAFPEPMEAAIAALAVGEISEPVLTEAGTHLITVTERRAGEAVDLDDVRSELERSLQTAAARRRLLTTVEELRDLSFNAPDLQSPAEQLSLEVRRSAPVPRGAGEGIFARERVQAVIFSDELLVQGHNSEVLELDPEHFLALRVAEHLLPEPLELTAVEDRIRDALEAERIEGARDELAETLLARLESGTSVEALAQETGYEWQVELGTTRADSALPAPALELAFTLPPPPEGEPRRSVASGESGERYLVELVRVRRGELAAMPESRRERLLAERVGFLRRQLEEAWIAALLDDADIEVYQ